MKLKNGFVTHEMDGEQIMVATGAAKFAGLVRSNSTAAYIVDCLKEDTTKEQIVEKMFREFDATRERLEQDVDKILALLRSINALEE